MLRFIGLNRSRLSRLTAIAGALLVLPAAALGANVIVDFDDKGTFQTSNWQKDGVAITGSSALQFLDLNGIGVVGGEDNTLDPGESLTFSFAAPVAFVRLNASAIGNLGGIRFHSAVVRAFNSDGAVIGTASNVEPFPSVVITGLFASTPLSSFSVLATEDSYRFSSVEFAYAAAVPEPPPATLVLCGLLTVCGWAWLIRGRSAAVM